MMEQKSGGGRSHVLVLPYPAHGHINPMFQLAKRLTSQGVKVTLAPTHFLAKSLQMDTGPIAIDPISDGCDERGRAEVDSLEAYLQRLEIAGSRTLAQLIHKHRSSGNSISFLVCDSFLTWALDVAEGFGICRAVFFTQSCAVDAIYYHIYRGQFTVPWTEATISLPGLPQLRLSDLPSLVPDPDSYPGAIDHLLLKQFSNLDRVDWLLFNTFDALEDEVVRWMKKSLPCKTIGPMVPSAYLDKSIEGDTNYAITLYDQNDACLKWLDTRASGSVVYISFGSIVRLVAEQMEELAWSLKGCNHHILWVVRATEEDKIPSNFKEEIKDRGLVVNWCPQLEVLAHRAIGCFVTHGGWNSILEALSLGVPLVAMPQWTDQPTNAKYVEDVWGVGMRVKVDEQGVVRREEMEHCIKKVMEGEKGREIKRAASKWKVLAREAMKHCGSSYKNLDEFLATFS